MRSIITWFLFCWTVFGQDKLRNTVSAKDLGAKGDAVTDDTAALARGIKSMCSVGGGHLDLSFGTYMIRPSAFAILPMCDNIEISGLNGTLKIASGSGSYDAILGSKNQTLSNVSIHHVNIDMNSRGNPVRSSVDLNTHPRIVLESGQEFRPGGSNIYIDHVHVTDVRSIWVFLIGASNSSITNCVIDHVGGGSVQTDSSIIYMDGEGEVIANNQIIASSRGANLAVTAIETHGGAQTITGNIAQDLQAGMNITGISTATATGFAVTGNVIRGTFQCIRLWSYGVFGATGYGMTDATVTGNTCIVNQLSYLSLETLGTQPFGIELDGASTLPFKNLKINSNSVSFDLSISPSEPFNPANLGIGYLDLLGTGECDNCDFSGNTVINAPLVAFRFAALGNNINFDNEIAINPGSSLNPGINPSFRTGLLWGTPTGAANGGVFSVKGGSYADDLTPSRMAYGILDAAGTTETDIIDGPTVSTADPTSPSLQGAISINKAGILPYIRATVNVPAGLARATINAPRAGSTIYSMKEKIMYTWDGVQWNWPNE
jgi:hypothetical protein